MTALCAGGSSSKQAGYADTIIGTTSIIDAILLSFGGLWLLPFVALVDIEAFDLVSLCTTDPPALPSFSADDVLALAHFGDLPAQSEVLGKIRDTINHYAWYQFCHCTSGTLTPAPAFPSQPSTVQIPVGNLASACFSSDWEGTPPVTPAANEWTGSTYLLAQIPGSGNTSFSPDGTHPVALKFAPQPPPTSVSWRMTHDTPTGRSGGAILWGFDSSAHQTVNAVLGDVGNSPNPQTGSVVIPSNTVYWTLYAANPSSTRPSDNEQLHLDFFCGGTTPGGANAACPTDPQTLMLLQQILGLLTLIQRQLAPFAYVPGPVHAGLSGNGSFLLSGAVVGLKIDLTSTPGRLGTIVGTPDDLFGAGWVNLGTADGYGPRIFITSDPTLILDVNPSVTTVGYSIPDDVTVTITELVRES